MASEYAMTGEQIQRARSLINSASKGPAVWAADPDDTHDKAVARFAEHLSKSDLSVCHIVEVMSDDEMRCLAMTGNGPTSAENARYIVGSLDPAIGWAATLDEVDRLQRLADERWGVIVRLEREIRELKAQLAIVQDPHG